MWVFFQHFFMDFSWNDQHSINIFKNKVAIMNRYLTDLNGTAIITDIGTDAGILRPTGLCKNRGSHFLIRPGDIHSKKRLTDCEHINLAFPARVLSDMFRYLDLSDVENQISQAKSIATVFLKKGELLLLKAKLEKLNLMPIDAPHRICVELRRQILDMMLQFIVPSFQETLEENCPHWLSQLLEELENPDMFSSDLKELTEYRARHQVS